MSPLDGKVASGDLRWEAQDISLQPIIISHRASYTQEKAEADFYAGLAFATAGAALIAGIQELHFRKQRIDAQIERAERQS